MVVLGGLCCLLAVAVGCVPRIEAFLSAPQRCCSAAVCTPGLGKVCPLSSPLHLPFTKETANSGVRASPLNRKPALSHSDSAESASAQPGSTAAVATATAETEGNEGIPREFANELIESFGLYAVSTIHARALPDTRDGLKPVHRRILFAMQQLGLNHSGPFRKSARVVGEVLGKFHPHGDKAVYDALVRLAQPFVSHLPLVEGHGNFGSVDGDPAAAMRYTECRLSAFCQDALFKDLHTSACSFRPNFDATEVEPECLPARVPLLLLQGTAGVAVGLATSLPPHNLKEVVAACIALIDNRRLPDSSLYRLLPAPDFPTGGLLVEGSAAALAYKEASTECAAVRDESDFSGIRVVFELSPEVPPREAWKHLLARTPLEVSVQCNFVALKDGKEPQRLSLRGLLEAWLEARLKAVRARTQREEELLLEEQHLLEGLTKAASCSNEIIKLLQDSADAAEATQKLTERPFAFTERQAQALLRMRLSSLLRLQQQQQQQKLEETRQKAVKLRHLLSDDRELYGVIKEELLEVATKYGVPRKTRFLRGGPPGSSQAIDADAILNGGRDESAETPKDTKSYLLLVTEGGLYKRIPEAALSLQRRGSTGQRCQSAGGVRAAAGTKWTVEASQSLDTTSRSSSKMSAVVAATACRDSDWLMLIWRDGRCLSLRGQQLQRHGLKASGSPLAAAVYSSRRRVTGKAAAADGTGEAGDVAGEGLCCVVQVNSGETDGRLVVATQKGLVKAVPLRLLLPSGTARKQRLRRLLALRRGDQVAGCVTISEGGQQKGGASGKESSEGLKDEAANGPTEQPAALLLGESKEKGFALKKRKLAHDETRERDTLSPPGGCHLEPRRFPRAARGGFCPVTQQQALERCNPPEAEGGAAAGS
ncbi:uncharacterized protein LOC34623017 [Cyclospora cayetanensis]|uniref:Uncharacterized protein LOC34623017 n=1 Tax=Cyclospora cayetanensis TaxID=88456 RepID=A0A6P6RTF6_9EIME|nr:uncharacterized protein LOC34623017 [Cyclospora cayetanensis]